MNKEVLVCTAWDLWCQENQEENDYEVSRRRGELDLLSSFEVTTI